MITKYLTYAKSLVFIQKCAEKNQVIIGIERFEFRGGNVHPDISGICDFSDATVNDSNETIKHSKKFMKKYGENKYERFEFVTL